MTLTTARLTPYEVPFKEPYVTASVRHETRRGVLVELQDDAGWHGVGEAAPLGSRTEDQTTCRKALEAATQRLTDQELAAEDALAELDATCPELAGAPAARFGLSLALCDLLARRADRPLAAWLAQRYTTGASPPAHVPVNATLPIQDLGTTVEHARGYVEEGFSCLKLKIGQDQEADLERVVAVREAVGPEVALRLDVNQAWAPMQAVENLLDLHDEVEIEYVEQPTHGEDHRALSMVREASPIPVAADEPVTSPAAAAELIELEAADVLILKPMVLGGLDRALQAAELAGEAGLDVVLTSTIDGAVARAGALHAAASLGPRELACGLATGRLLAEDVVPYDEGIQDGRMPVPTGPGLGLALPGDKGASS